jgi:hypothetical protein
MRPPLPEALKKPIKIKNPVSPALPGQLVIATPPPQRRMSHYSGTDHIQIHISKTVEQMLPILDDGALIGVFPNRFTSPFRRFLCAANAPDTNCIIRPTRSGSSTWTTKCA